MQLCFMPRHVTCRANMCHCASPGLILCCPVLCISHALTPVPPRLIHREHAHSTERDMARDMLTAKPHTHTHTPQIRTIQIRNHPPPFAVPLPPLSLSSSTTPPPPSHLASAVVTGTKDCSSTSQARAGILAVISLRPTFPRSPTLLRRRPVPDLWQVPGRPSCSLIPNWPSGAAWDWVHPLAADVVPTRQRGFAGEACL